MTQPTVQRRTGVAAGFAAGVGDFFRGFGLWATSPRVMLLGAVPALLVGLIVVAALFFVAQLLPGFAGLVTPFAEEWAPTVRDALRVVVAGAMFLLLVLVAVATFTALTLAVGDPFYERIWLRVERRIGDFDEVETGFWESMRRGFASGLRLLLLSLVLGLGVFLLGLIPLVGPPIAFVVGALGGGLLLSAELLGRPFDARAVPAVTQRALRKQDRARVLGFGVAAYLVFLLPLGAVVAMPAAVAGSTVLARRLLGERVAPVDRAGSAVSPRAG